MADEVVEGFSISGTMRLRYEAIGGQARAGFNATDDLLNARTTVAARYHGGRLEAAVEIYDSRVWGERTGTPFRPAK
ncbi:hypothetical protein [Novosphingobium panipatense]|uniref:hypothetical protein n=1 Tax=Novosphingobium panipatense TaxID=428991 RepID=UPI00361AB419